MDLITHDPGRYHVSLDTVWEFEETILADPRVHNKNLKYNILSALPNLFWRALFDLRSGAGNRPTPSPQGRKDAGESRHTFAVLMGPNFRKIMPRYLLPGRKAIYLFDAWPATHKRIRQFVEACHVDHLFLSSRQGTQKLKGILPRTSCHWIPEGINPGNYRSVPSSQKNIDVLQLGRRYDRYHEMIAVALEEAGAVYLYEKSPGKIIFPTQDNYLDGLARSKISICVPLTMTHPELAEGVETMTVRYLQSMLSKCLIVGHAPEETIELFGYNPVIEMDFTDPVNQLSSLLKNIGDYAPLIEKNYQIVLEQHTWKQRWDKIAQVLLA